MLNNLLNNSICIEYKPRRELFSLREAIVLADVSEKRVRKDLETGILESPKVVRMDNSRLACHWTFVVTLAAVYGNLHLTVPLRKTALSRMDEFSFCRNWMADLASSGSP